LRKNIDGITPSPSQSTLKSVHWVLPAPISLPHHPPLVYGSIEQQKIIEDKKNKPQQIKK